MTETNVPVRPTVVIAATTSWQEMPTVWRQLLQQVWELLRARGVEGGARNVMLYLDDVPHVEVGVELDLPGPLPAPVVSSSLPSGRAAMTTHRGSYAELGAAHQAVSDWCTEHGRRPAGPRWEVYGPHRPDPADVWVEVYWLLA